MHWALMRSFLDVATVSILEIARYLGEVLTKVELWGKVGNQGCSQ